MSTALTVAFSAGTLVLVAAQIHYSMVARVWNAHTVAYSSGKPVPDKPTGLFPRIRYSGQSEQPGGAW